MNDEKSREPLERPRAWYCGARRTKKTGWCHHRAGWGTIHVGRGRCRLHGGITRVDDGRLKAGGRYSEVLPQQLRERYEAFLEEGESLRSVASEVAVQRMLFATFLQPALRKALEEIRNGKEFPLGMIDRMMSWLAEISKTAMRLSRIEGFSAPTQADLQILEMTVVDLFAKYIEDEGKRLEAVNELAWRLGRVAQERQERPLLAEVDDD